MLRLREEPCETPVPDPHLVSAVQLLPHRQRVVIVARYWADWSEADIASALGCRPGTVKSLASQSSGSAAQGLPQPLRNAARKAISHLLEEPVPALADPFPDGDPLPGAYRLHLPSDGLTIWYNVTEDPDGQVVIVVQYVKADT